jgi:hypothetical protein
MATRVREHFVDVSSHLVEVGLATLREIDVEGQQTSAENLVRVEYAHISLIPAVPKTVLRKCETFETCEIGEIFLNVFSTTCVFSIAYERTSGNESYLRSQNPINNLEKLAAPALVCVCGILWGPQNPDVLFQIT